MGYYPVFLELTGRPCVVIGGGPVAERKVEGLLATGAAVTVVSPELGTVLEALASEGKIRHIRREYRHGDLADSQLAFAATGDREANAAVAREGRERGVWVNAADDPAHCDFILPGVIRRGELVVAVATGGSSPALSRAIREELEAYFTEDYAQLAEVVGKVRQELRRHALAPDGKKWRRALDGHFRGLIADSRSEEAEACLLERLGGAR